MSAIAQTDKERFLTPRTPFGMTESIFRKERTVARAGRFGRRRLFREKPSAPVWGFWQAKTQEILGGMKLTRTQRTKGC